MLNLKERGMYIPSLGDEVTLACDWTFGLFYERRNEMMVRFMHPETEFKFRGMLLSTGEKLVYGEKISDVQLPKGAVLKVKRIYIRNGAKDFDSVTFTLQSLPKKKISVPHEYSSYSNGEYTRKVGKFTKVRFWAKLKDVNTMRFVMGREDFEKEAKPAVYRLLRVIDQLKPF
jgi:hypothetical protein